MHPHEYDEDDLDILLRRETVATFHGSPSETKEYWRDLADLREPLDIPASDDDYPGLDGYRSRRFPADQDYDRDDWN
jgi:hypothetical protein